MDNFFKAVVIAVLVYSTKCTDTSVCVQKSSCLCEFSQYSKIDISNATQKDTSPLNPKDFISDTFNNVTYYFHGCTDGIFNLTEHGLNISSNGNQTVKGSLIVVNNSNVTVLGYSSQIKFHLAKDNDGQYDMLYEGAKGTISASIRLLCNNFNEPFIKALGNNSNTQLLALSSPHACIVTHHPGLSTGSVLVILFFIATGIYLIGGAAVLYFIRGARGLELIPNIDFWRELPGLVKDGIIFLFSGCRVNSINTPESYDRI